MNKDNLNEILACLIFMNNSHTKTVLNQRIALNENLTTLTSLRKYIQTLNLDCIILSEQINNIFLEITNWTKDYQNEVKLNHERLLTSLNSLSDKLQNLLEGDKLQEVLQDINLFRNRVQSDTIELLTTKNNISNSLVLFRKELISKVTIID